MNPTGNAFGLDIQAEQDRIARRQQLADLIRQSTMQQPQGQMVSGHFVPPNFLQHFVPALGMLLANKAQDRIADDQRNLAANYNKQLAGGLDQYFALRDGQSEQPGTAPVPAQTLPTEDNLGYAMPENPGLAPTPAQPGDPRRAAIMALTSGLPALAQLGQTDLAAMGKGQMTVKDYLGLSGFDPTSRVRAGLTNNPTLLQPEERFHTLNDQLFVTQGGGQPQRRLDARDQFGAPVLQQGDLFQQNLGTGKFDQMAKAPKITIGPTTVKSGEDSLFRTLGKNAADAFTELGKTALSSRNLMGTLKQLERLEQGGVFDGPLSGAAVWLQGLSRSAGLRYDAAKLSNSEAYTSLAREAVQQLVSQYGGNRGITKEEAAQIQDIIPQLSQSAAARRQLRLILTNVGERNLRDYRTAADALQKSRQLNDEGVFVDAMTRMNLPDPTPLNPAANTGPDAAGEGPAGAGLPPGLQLPPGWRIRPLPAAGGQ